MRMPMKARQISVKTLIAGLGIALLSACSGSPTAPSAPARSSIKTPIGRNDFTGYVVAENDSSGHGQGLITAAQQIARRVPADTSSNGSQQ
jgi:hypothetical protein